MTSQVQGRTLEAHRFTSPPRQMPTKQDDQHHKKPKKDKGHKKDKKGKKDKKSKKDQNE